MGLPVAGTSLERVSRETVDVPCNGPGQEWTFAMDRPQKLATGSIVVGLLVLGLKFGAYYLTGSIALYSDALESIVNVITAFVSLLAVRTSAKPADADHPYGHGKVEYFSAVIVGVFIVV